MGSGCTILRKLNFGIFRCAPPWLQHTLVAVQVVFLNSCSCNNSVTVQGRALFEIVIRPEEVDLFGIEMGSVFLLDHIFGDTDIFAFQNLLMTWQLVMLCAARHGKQEVSSSVSICEGLRRILPLAGVQLWHCIHFKFCHSFHPSQPHNHLSSHIPPTSQSITGHLERWKTRLS